MYKYPGSATLWFMHPALPCLALACSFATTPADEEARQASDGSNWERTYQAPKAGYRRAIIHPEAKPEQDE